MLGRVHRQHQDPWVLSQLCCHLNKECTYLPLSPDCSLYCSEAPRREFWRGRKEQFGTVMSPTCPVISSLCQTSAPGSHPTGKSESESQTQIVPDLDTPK